MMVNFAIWLQTLGAGTFDEILGPGNTPSWALSTDMIKYQRDQLITNEQGFNLQNVVSKCIVSELALEHAMRTLTLASWEQLAF